MDVVKKDDWCDNGEILLQGNGEMEADDRLWQRLKGGAGRSSVVFIPTRDTMTTLKP